MYTFSIIVSMCLVAAYIFGAVRYKHGECPSDMKEIAYALPDGWRWLTSVWMAATVYTLTPKLFLVIPDRWEVCAHCFATAMTMLCILPMLKHEGNKSHQVLDVVSSVFGQICVIIINPLWLALWLVVPVLMVRSRHDMSRRWQDGRIKLVCSLLCYATIALALLFA